MAVKLKDRNRQIPGGLKYWQPETKWAPVPWSSFQSIVDQLIAHRKGNPSLLAKHGWQTDRESVTEQVDDYNARLCQQMGWSGFIMEGSAAAPDVPFQHLRSKLRNVAGGNSTLVEWIDDGAQAVPIEKAIARAQVCKDCPQNGKGDFTRWFTVPVSEAIRFELNRRREMKLETPLDDYLGVCEACSCPLKLKIHVPIDLIRERIQPEAMAALDPRCWIPKET